MDTITRHRERARSNRDALYAVLDAVCFGTLATVVDGLPWVVPLLFARDGDRVLLHGSTGAGALRHVAAGAPVALCVTALDGIVVADSTFDSSANYRSAVVRGTIEPVQPEGSTAAGAQARALRVLSEKIIPGRSLEVRPNTDREYAATLALALPIRDGEWTVKVRTGGPTAPDPRGDVRPGAGPEAGQCAHPDGDPDVDVWTGVVPVVTTYGPAVPSPWLPSDLPLPASVATLVGAR